MKARQELLNNVIKTYTFNLDHTQSGYRSLDDLMIENIIPNFFDVLTKYKGSKMLLPWFESWVASLFYNYYLTDDPDRITGLRYPRKLLLTYLKVMNNQQGFYRPLDMDKMFDNTIIFNISTFYDVNEDIKPYEIFLELQKEKQLVLLEFLNIPFGFIG